MKKIKYLFNRILHMDFSQMKEKINEINKKTKKSKFLIFIDMIYCGFKYQAGYMDYYLFEMNKLNNSQRKTIMTRGKNNALIKKYNDPNFIHFFDNKGEFNNKFIDFIKRDWIVLTKENYDEFKSFLSNKDEIICKPLTGSCGKGIEKLKVGEYKNKKDLYNYLINNNLLLIEEVIKQHDVMNKLNPSSINTIRIVTINNGTESEVVVAYLRIGNGKFVDNFNSGGMVVPINEKVGEINYPALDKSNNLFYKHPTTNTDIVGFKIPFWNEVLEYTLALSKVIKEVGMVGWDIAISTDGPTIVEGNNYPGHDIYQLPPHRTNGIGVLPKFKKFL